MNLDKTRLKSAKQIGEGKGVAACRRRLDPYNMSSLHWHEYYEMEIVLSGSGWTDLNGKKYELKKGNVYFLTPVDFHLVKAENDLEVYNIGFLESAATQSLISEISENPEDKILCFADADYRMICNLADALTIDDKTDVQYTQNIMDAILMLFLKNLKKKSGVTSDDPGQRRIAVPVQRAAMYLKLHFRENPSLADVAATVNLNASYFCKIFADEMGITPKKYLADLKIDYAKKLLAVTDLSVTEICFACGYSSVSNFLCYFRKNAGVSPTAYRRSVCR